MILIVDDNKENIFSLKSLLNLHRFEVDTATSGEEALRKILQNSYSLVVLDVQMPDMDGFEVAEAMAGYSISKEIPIIFLSAVNTQKKFITKGYATGGIDYVVKPFDPDILLLKIKTFHRLSEQNRQLGEMEKTLRKEIEWRKRAEGILEKKVDERTQELRRSNARLEESNNDLRQFAFIASHDLQEPLRKIQTFSDIALIKYKEDQGAVGNYLEKINSSANRLRDLITDLLKYSQINSVSEFVNTDLNKIINEIIFDLGFPDPNREVTFNISKIPEIEIIPSEMRQVFQNLITNSIKFCRPDVGCVIDIKAERVDTCNIDAVADSRGDFCRITVSDNGIGFNPDYKDRIFDIFQRLNNRSAYEGNGIGLAIVKKVVERHDGVVAARGLVNQGASFIIVVPIRHRQPGEATKSS